MMKPPCKILEWDTEFWGFRTATVTVGDRLDESVSGVIQQWCEEHDVRCLYFLADGTCPLTLSLAARQGYRFIDCRMDLECDLRARPHTHANAADATHFVRISHDEDLAAVCRLAGSCHFDTRFFKDIDFPRSKAAQLYSRWVDADHARRSLLIAFHNSSADCPIGYVSYSQPQPNRGRIGLIGVDPQHRGQGIAGALLDAAIRTLRDAGCNHVDVATQATNVAALRLYGRRGFLPSSAKIWFHRWW